MICGYFHDLADLCHIKIPESQMLEFFLATSGTLATQQPIPRTARYSAMTIPQWVRYVAWTNALCAHFEFHSCLFCISLHGDQQHVLKRIPLMQRWRLSLRTADRDWDPIGTPAFDTTNCGMTDTRQPLDMELSWNRGTPTSSMFMAFSIIKPPFWGLYHHLWTPPYHGLLLKISSLSWWSSEGWPLICGFLGISYRPSVLTHSMCPTNVPEGGCALHVSFGFCTYVAGWWFGTSMLFSHILGIIIPIDSYFSEGFKPPTSFALGVFSLHCGLFDLFFINPMVFDGSPVQTIELLVVAELA